MAPPRKKDTATVKKAESGAAIIKKKKEPLARAQKKRPDITPIPSPIIEVAVESRKKQTDAVIASRLHVEQVRKAVAALLKWVESQKQGNKAQLLDDDDMFYLVVSLKRTPDRARTNGYQIPLPHSLYPLGGGREVCLLVKDSKDSGHKEAKEKVRKELGSTVSKVIGVTKLRTKYKPFEAKRQLCGSYDLFVADDRVIGMLPKLLGKTFFKKKKHPIPVCLKGGNWADKIRKACDSTYLYTSGGPCSVVRTARTDQSENEIMENVLAVAAGVAEHVPRKWKNVQSVYLKTRESASLPLYNSLPDLPLKILPQAN